MFLMTNYRPWSVGIVVENKPRDTYEIKVVPIEFMPFSEEELAADSRTRKKQGIDHTERLYTVSVTEQNWIPAEWVEKTYSEKAPDVAKGEQVMLYRLGDSDRIFWSSMGRNDDHRKQEDVILSWSAKRDYDPKLPQPKTKENSYRLQINTYDKFVNFSTSDDNGEYTTYNMRFDTDKGYFELIDKEGNYILLDTKATHIKLFNKDNSLVSLIKKEIFIQSPDLVQFDTKTWTVNCTTCNINAKTATINANNFTLNSSNATIKGGKLKVESETQFTSTCEWDIPLKGVKLGEVTPGNK